jgi:hypothetical protein
VNQIIHFVADTPGSRMQVEFEVAKAQATGLNTGEIRKNGLV